MAKMTKNLGPGVSAHVLTKKMTDWGRKWEELSITGSARGQGKDISATRENIEKHRFKLCCLERERTEIFLHLSECVANVVFYQRNQDQQETAENILRIHSRWQNPLTPPSRVLRGRHALNKRAFLIPTVQH